MVLRRPTLWLFPLLSNLAVLVFCYLLYVEQIPGFVILAQRVEAMSYDLRMRLTVSGQAEVLPPIVIVDIDESSLKSLGQWPWPRQRLAALIDRLAAAKAAVIALDITLAEVELNPVDHVLTHLPAETAPELRTTLATLRAELDGDTQLATSLAKPGRTVILGYLFNQSDPFRKGAVRDAVVSWGADTPLAQLSSLEMQGYTANVPQFAAAAAQNGFFNVFPDDDGVIRRVPLVAEWNGKLYSSLALETVRHYLGAGHETVQLLTRSVGSVQAITYVLVAGKPVRTDAMGQIAVPFLGPSGVFSYLSAAEVLNGSSVIDLTDAIVLVGTSARGLVDLRTTPLQTSYPGVEIQASLVHGLLNPELIPFEPEWVRGGLLVELLGLTLVMTLLYPRLQPRGMVVTGVVLVGLVLGFDLWLWQVQRMDWPLVPPLLLVAMSSLLFGLYRLLYEYQTRQRIQGMFGQYVPAGHIRRLLSSRSVATMEGERREMTVLFADIRSFASLSEPLSTQQLKRFLNHYLTPITEIIFQHQGTVDKYVGDLVMAFWGAPLTDEEHAQHAVLAALDMQHKLLSMQPEFRALGLSAAVRVGIGIHSGEMNVGDMGSAYRRAYTVLGDAVNLGSRLEGLTKYYDLDILVSEATMLQCPAISFRLIDCVRVLGRAHAVWVYQPLGLKTALSAAASARLAEHDHTLQAYYAGDWEQARLQFQAWVLEEREAGLYQLFLERMAAYGNPAQAPADWDGVFIHQGK